MTRVLIFLSLVAGSCLSFAQVTRPLVQADISRMAETAHLELKGLKTWNYDLKKEGDKNFVMTVPAMDEASIQKLKAFKDPYVSSVNVDKTGPDGTHMITFQLTHSDVEAFDYQTDDPSRLIVDFYRKMEPEGKSVVQTPPKLKAAPAPKGKTTVKENVNRSPAGDEVLSVEEDEFAVPEKKIENISLYFGMFDGGDRNYDRFRIKDYEIREDAIISARHNVYLPFPMLKMNVSLLDQLMAHQPEYVIRPKDSKENKEARLLLALFNRKRFGVFLKTYDYFVKKYPESEYLEILKNIAAHVYLSRWKENRVASEFDKARALYNELVQKFPKSPLREHNYLLLGFALFEYGEALPTLQTFEGFIEAYPKAPEIPQVRKANAEAYLILTKYDDARVQLETIIKEFPDTDHAREAQYRLGDVLFASGDYSAAIRTYEKAIKDLPKQESIYPNANYNMAEARFWQKDYKKALNDYVRFITLFPTHDHGGYALARVGELLDILGADPRRVMGSFLESYFRFPNHPGAQVARIRMLSQQMKGMKPTELKKTLDEIQQVANKLSLPGIPEFTTLMVSEGLSRRGEYRQALSKLISFYQKNPSAVNLDSFRSRILRNIASELKDTVDKGNFLKSLEFYSEYSNTWLRNSDRIDVPYLLARTFETAGAYNEAQKLYGDTLKIRQAIVGTDTEKEKKVQEYLPSVSTLKLRLAAVLAEERKYIDSYEILKSIGATSELAPAEVVERVQLNALIAEQRDDHTRAREALQDLAKKWQGDPALVAPVNLKLAQTFLKLKDPKQAEIHAEQVLKAEGGETPVADRVVAEALTAKGDALVDQKKAVAAVETYQNLLDRYENNMPLGQVRYKVGQLLFDRGDFQGAYDVWNKLAGTSNDFLWQIGKEKLEDSKWRGEFSKYVNQIPVMNRRPAAAKER